MKCPYCGYEWEQRKVRPVSCPRCKRRLDYLAKKGRDRRERDKISQARKIERGFQRTMYVMSILTPKLEEKGVKPVIVGGAGVEFYTRDWYATGDIDLAIDRNGRNKLGEVLESAGFTRSGRMWVREELDLYIEAPGDINDIDMERVTRVETEEGYVYVIGIEDIIFDRIQAAEHWNSESDKEQAIRMIAIFYDEIDWDYLREKCREELSDKMLEDVMREAADANDDTG